MSDTAAATPALSLQGLSTSFFTYRGVVEAVRDVSFDLAKGEMLGLVGETGSGKSVLVHSIVNQVRFPGRVVGGKVLLDGQELTGLDDETLRDVRGRRIAVIGSNPRQLLDPLSSVGVQLGRAIRAHVKLPDSEIRARVLAALEAVRIPDARRRHDAFPHELSVGMAQRVVIAMALLHEPVVIIADEPTAGLDVTVQRQVLDLMKALLADLGSSAMIVTRDLGIVAHYCDRIGVMQDGRLLEVSAVRDFFRGPSHAEGRRLLDRALAAGTEHREVRVEVRERTAAPAAPGEQPLLQVRDLVKHFPIHGSHHTVKAVNGVSFDLGRGQALGLVGESGSGKTTVGRLVLGLIGSTAGSIVFDGQETVGMSDRQLRPLRPKMQMVFQEPHASLNPHMTVARNIEEPLILQGEADRLDPRARRDRVRELLQLVQLREDQLDLYPHNLSAGQAQRVGVARAIATSPRLIVLDEPTSLLDISVRGEILEVLNRVKEELGMSYIFISHDLTAVRAVCSRIAIMYLGQIIELGDADALFAGQRHPYSKALLASVLFPDPDERPAQFSLSGEIPSPVDLPSGCFLHGRCPLVQDDCRATRPPLVEQLPGWQAACLHTDVLLSQAEPGER